MLTKDDIVFEEDIYAHSHVHSQEEVSEALVELINTFAVEHGIKRLDKVIVKKPTSLTRNWVLQTIKSIQSSWQIVWHFA